MEKEEILKKVSKKNVVVGEMEKAKINKACMTTMYILYVAGVL